MCDDDFEKETAAYLSRRDVLGAGAAAAAMLVGCTQPGSAAAPTATATATADPGAGDTGEPPARATTNRRVTIKTPDGEAEAFFVAPADGAHPGVVMWPDVAGLREAYETMATRLAGAGYAVLAVNQYYRSTKLPVLTSFAEWRTEEGKAKITPMREAITPEGIAKDGAAFAAWLDQQKEVDPKKKLASTGYCMGGPFTFYTAAAVPERFGVVASFHGGGLVTDAETSPHKLLAKTKVAALICIAQNDDEKQPEAKTTLSEAAAAAERVAEIEVYPAQHGFCTIDSPVYDKVQAERAWSRMLAMFERHL